MKKRIWLAELVLMTVEGKEYLQERVGPFTLSLITCSETIATSMLFASDNDATIVANPFPAASY